MLRPGITSNCFYLSDGDLVDVTMLDWETRNKGGAKYHSRRQAITKLSIIAQDLQQGNLDLATEEQIKLWIQQATS